MYSFMDSHENGFVYKPVEKQFSDLMCMLYVIPYIDDLPKYDQYDEYYIVGIEADSSRQPMACCWEEEVQLQHLKYSTQPMHINHDSNEENPENLKAGERSLPLCLTSFQLLRENFPKIRNQQFFNCDSEHEEDNELLDQDSLPLCFSSFEKNTRAL